MALVYQSLKKQANEMCRPMIILPSLQNIDYATSLFLEINLWVSTACLGMFYASVFPSLFHMAEVYIDVTGKFGTYIVFWSM